MDLAALVGTFKEKHWYFRFERHAGSRTELITAHHRARRGLQRAAARIFEYLSRLEHRLFADDAGAAHFLNTAVRVGNVPVAREELYRFAALVLDRHPIGPHVAALRRIGLILEIGRFHGNANAVRSPRVN